MPVIENTPPSCIDFWSTPQYCNIRCVTRLMPSINPSLLWRLFHGDQLPVGSITALRHERRYTVKEADNRLYGMLKEDGTWPGMIGELVNKTVDMGVGDLSWTLDRSIAVDLTEAVFPETVTFIYRTPGFYSRTWILFEDIDFRVWISLTFAMILGCSVYCLTLYVSEACGIEGKRPESKEEAFVQAAVRSTAAIYKTLVGQSILHHPKAISCRTVLGTWFIGALILSSLYGGSLTSTLSLHRSPRPADTLKDLVKRYPNAQLAVKDSSQIHSYVKKSEVWRHMWLTNMQKYVIPGKLHIEDTMEEVHKSRPEGQPIYVWIAERSMLVKQMHKYSDDPSVCDLYVAKEDIVRSDWVLALTKNSPFLPQFNEKITRMHRFGLLQKWQIEHWNSNQGACRPSDGRNQNGGRAPISIRDTQACFFILSMGWVAGFIVLFIERSMDRRRIHSEPGMVLHKRKRRKQRKRDLEKTIWLQRHRY
ncbi:glutamate receptor ionotropic, delta-2 [Caerostris darwini]|uniref:Glutamate receptor ionotropic, delta-2 n=1 Tax=Caerostris darwini TaxID=1538125 RepID=A0AAV4SJ98_9ARAC|nr:glutamate receptor ionotropic, delta-2 [Caerostris darwini]